MAALAGALGLAAGLVVVVAAFAGAGAVLRFAGLAGLADGVLDGLLTLVQGTKNGLPGVLGQQEECDPEGKGHPKDEPE